MNVLDVELYQITSDGSNKVENATFIEQSVIEVWWLFFLGVDVGDHSLVIAAHIDSWWGIICGWELLDVVLEEAKCSEHSVCFHKLRVQFVHWSWYNAFARP